jgi:hypothetical protein
LSKENSSPLRMLLATVTTPFSAASQEHRRARRASIQTHFRWKKFNRNTLHRLK